eukprot:TRINITY_DN10508_c0_g1_i1.p1 TRINITY_DN10508_c0_g1~~TRINITY_DN10508_c0_g1_i1.p1  ORF type:complete len:293 (+),score=38.41 TRINITY_DN10508_c0_g1_i1:119-997(+)
MPLCTEAPIIHPGPLHVGPAIPWALKGPKDHPPQKKIDEFGDFDVDPPNSKKKKRPRKKWDERHEVTWKNDAQAPNTRDYFDRRVDRVDVPVMPRRRLRPTWVLDCPEVEAPNQVYRVFDAITASWKEQPQWAMPSLETLARSSSMSSRTVDRTKVKPGGRWPRSPEGKDKEAPAAENSVMSSIEDARKQAAALQPKVRTPRKPPDLRQQREKETDWDGKHAVVYSKDNQHYQVNVRSYFDRWKDHGGAGEREPTWRLKIERKPLIAKSASAPFMPSFQPQGGRYGAWHPVF